MAAKTLLTITGAIGVEGGPNLSYVATNLTIGSGIGGNTSTLSSEIPSSSMSGTSAVAGTRGILLISNFGIPAHSTGSTSALLAGTHITKKNLKLTEPVIKSLPTLVCIGKHDAHKIVHSQLMQHGNNNRQKEIGKRLGPELGYRYMDIVDYMLLPPIFLFQMALTFKTLIVSFLVHYFHHNMFVVIGWEDYLIQRSLMMMILLSYHITINILKFFQNVYPTLLFWPHCLWHLLGPSSKGQSILNILFNTHAPARSLQKDDLWSIHASRRLPCHHYDHQLSSGIQVCGDSKHQAQPMNQSFVAAINAATSYKPIVNPFRLGILYKHIQSDLTLPPDCFLSQMLACISIIMIFTTIIITKSVQYRLSRWHVTTKSSPEHHSASNADNNVSNIYGSVSATKLFLS